MLVRLAIAGMLAAGTAGCAVSPLTVSRPYPVHGNPVNPTPAPGYRVVCSTGEGLDFLLFPVRTGHCEQVIVAPAALEGIRVRG